MRQAVLITAYTNIHHLTNIIDALDNNNFLFFIHIDRKSKIKPDETLQLKQNKNIKLISNKYKINWGGRNHLEAALLLIKAAFEDKEIKYFHFITGHDYPIKTSTEITNYLKENNGKSFIGFSKLPHKNWKGGGMERVLYYNFYDLTNGRSGWGKWVIRLFVHLQKLFRIKRPFPSSFPETLYGGGTYWTLHRECINYVLSYIEKHPDYFDRFNYTFCSEEIFFQTLLLNSPLKDTIVNNNLRFIVWENRNGNSPANLDETDYDSILKSEAFFARKFEYPVSEALLKKVRDKIQG